MQNTSTHVPQASTIDEKSFDALVQGQRVKLYKLTTSEGLTVQITNYGAKIVSLWVPDVQGQLDDVVLGFPTLDQWLTQEVYFNGINGRTAGRISGAQFDIDNTTYHLTKNHGEDTLHGGQYGFNDKVWDVIQATPHTIQLHYLSPDGQEGFPGNLHVYVTYEVTGKDLLIRYSATTDQPTIINLTNHAYFNLNGEGSGSIRDHRLQVLAHEYIPYDENAIPLGTVLPVTNTPMDMRTPIRIGDCIDHPFFAPGLGIDNGWALPGWDQTTPHQALRLAAVLSTDKRTMQTWTTLPCMQIYSGNYIENHIGKSHSTYQPQCAICLEAEMFPDAIHHPLFPNTILRANEEWKHQTLYRFL